MTPQGLSRGTDDEDENQQKAVSGLGLDSGCVSEKNV